MPARKEPMRMCVGCMEMKSKKELIRIVKNKDGEVSLDTTGKAQGRGAYLCNSLECFDKIKKSRRLEKTFEMKIPEEVYSEMQKKLEV